MKLQWEALTTSDLIQAKMLIVSSISLFFSVLNAFTMLALQIKQNTYEKKKDKEEIYKHSSNLLYLLEDTINKTLIINVFNIKIINSYFNLNEYMNDIHYLNGIVLDSKESIILEELVSLLDTIFSKEYGEFEAIKPLYKNIIDQNINPNELNKLKENKRYIYIVNFKYLSILYKLQKVTGKELIKDDDINICKFKSTITKHYDENHYLKHENNEINGFIREYETVFYNPSFLKEHPFHPTTTYEMVFEGFINNGVKDGKGKYLYYSKENGFSFGVNSKDLNREIINIDNNAMMINKFLKANNKPDNCYAVFNGTFEKGFIKDGTIDCQEKPNGEITTITVGNRTEIKVDF